MKSASNYFLLSILIATTASPFFFDANEFLILGFLISLFFFFIRGKKFDQSFFIVLFLFLSLEFIQLIAYQTFSLDTFLALLIKLGFAYFVVRCLGGSFFQYYVRILCTICLISLFFYLISFIPGVYDYIYYNITGFFDPPFYKTSDFYTAKQNIILYTFDYEVYLTYRNPGPFWEPGIFAVFIILAMIFNIIIENKLFTITNLIFVITLLTTISTGGYLALFLLIFSYYMSNKQVKFKLPYLIVSIILSIYLFFNLSFLSGKVTQNLETMYYTGSRFGSLIADWNLFVESPWIGWGRGSMRYGGDSSEIFTQDHHRNNGLAALITQYGIILSLCYFYFYYLTLKKLCQLYNYNSSFAIMALLVIIFISFSQIIYSRQFFLSLLFIGLHFKKYNSNVSVLPSY